jgi:cold shock CspA family protein
MNRKVGECVKMVDRSYGFIRDANYDDFFVHFSSIVNRKDYSVGFLQVGDWVEFDVAPGKGGLLQAINVKIL